MASKRRTLPNQKPLSTRGRLILVALVLWTLFIWSRSCYAGPASRVQSGVVVSFAQPFFAGIGIVDVELMTFLVRKAGHFTEYTILGVLLGLSNEEKRLSWPQVIYGIAVPSIDETIQLFVPERSGQITDVLLDCCGIAFGMLLTCGIRKLMSK